ncbi:RHS repeat-associated core domain-containing protein [Acaryochloris marina]|uniref:RHS repeat-associated core domain-containing protein n=1 Tax=Acaryochloris marina TaxID=155978 RepID=UPI001BB0BA94|nr:RHS repeat-associated core domain-containing protein [Acaryochloris marina]QUY44819.1 putative Ig domain-containing protein [Acaryochloris marina S15]
MGGSSNLFGNQDIPASGLLEGDLLDELGKDNTLGDVLDQMGSKHTPAFNDPVNAVSNGIPLQSTLPSPANSFLNSTAPSGASADLEASDESLGIGDGPFVGDISSEDLVMHLTLDEASGNVAVDISPEGQDNNGLLRSGAQFVDIGGSLGGGVQFDGINDFIAVSDTRDINLGEHSQRTISIWFKADSTQGNDKQVIYEEGGTTRGLNIYLDEGRLYVGGWNRREENWQGTFLSTDTVQENVWHHVSLVLNVDNDPEIETGGTGEDSEGFERETSTLQSQAFSAYLDGEQFGVGQGATLHQHSDNIGIGGINQNTRFHDGVGRGSGTQGIKGIIADARVYNRVLTDSEIDLLAQINPVDQAPPVINAELANDTAPTGTNNDGITSAPTVIGQIVDASPITSFRAGLNNTPIDSYIDVLNTVQSDGSFTLDQGTLNQILGSTLPDGSYTLNLLATDAFGNTTDSQVIVSFVLDTAVSTISFDLAPESDSAPVGDQQTTLETVRLIGTTEANASVLMNPLGQVVEADDQGQFAFEDVPLDIGLNELSIIATDVAGNQQSFTQTFERVVAAAAPEITAPPALTVDEDTALQISGISISDADAGSSSLEVTLSVDHGILTLSQTSGLTFNTGNGVADASMIFTGTLADINAALTDLIYQGELDFNGTDIVNIAVDDLSHSGSGLTDSQSIDVTVNPVNDTPVLENIGNQNANLGEELTFTAVATDPDLPSDQLSFSLASGAPAGAAIDPTTGIFSWTPDANQAIGDIEVSIVVTDNGTPPLSDTKIITVSVSDPNAPVNQAPVFDPVGPLSVMPGARLAVQLMATDPDGDAVSYFLQPNGPLPTGMLESDGTLVFNPSPDQLGTYEFTVVASDGIIDSTQTVTLEVVPDPITTTRISGVIQDIDQTPLAGVVLELGGTQTTTAADGSFTLEFPNGLPDDTLNILPESINTADVIYPAIAEKVGLLLERDPFTGVNNIIDRPIYLPALDIANAVPIDPAVDTMVTTEAIPEAAVFVAAGSLETMNGDPFTGSLSITEVPVDFTPASLPENLLPELVVTIQPGEMQFTTPAPLSLPNNSGFEPGTVMDLWSINPETGDFENVGSGRVSADGSVIETFQGGIQSSSWHFFAPQPEIANDPNGNTRNEDNTCQKCKVGGPSTSEVEFHSGALIETHDLVNYQSLGVSRGINLTYDSLRADPRPIVNFGFSNIRGSSDRRLQASLTINRGNFEYQVPGGGGSGRHHYWSVGSGDIDAALQADLSTLPSGTYDYQLTTGVLRQRVNSGFVEQPDGTFDFFRRSTNSFTGSTSSSEGMILHVNSVDSAFGSGWGLAGLQEIVENPDGSVLLIDGDGSEILYDAPDTAGGIYKAPPGDFSNLEKLADGTFKITFKDQTALEFNTDNFLSREIDRNGNETQYIYNNSGNLTTIIDPVGLETTFSYTNDRITEISDPAGRITQLEYDVMGNLVRITDPDGTSRTFEYDADHHMTAEIDQRGNREEATYDFAGRLEQAIRKDGSVIEVDPLQVQGLYTPEETAVNPFNFNGVDFFLNSAPSTFRLGSAESTYVDANGNTIVNTLDQAGQLVSSTDDVGSRPQVRRNQDNLITSSTDARGNSTVFSYDDNGNILRVEDVLSGRNTFSGSIAEPGERDEFSFDGVAGQRIFFDDLSESFFANVTLVDPNGSNVFGVSSRPVTLNQDGTYTLSIRGNSDDIGDYQFRLLALDNNVPDLTLTTTVTDSLFPGSEADFYRFSGTAGERLRFNSLSLSDNSFGTWSLYGPNNQLISNTSLGFDFLATLPVDGDYLLVLNGSQFNSGTPVDYSFQVVTPETTTAALTIGDTVSGTIDEVGDQAEFTFAGTTGQQLYYDALGLSSNVSLSLEAPDGTRLFNFFADVDFDAGPITLTQDGAYRLIIGGDNISTGDYSFRVLDVPATAQSVTLDTPVTGTLDPSREADFYRLSGTAGERIRLDSLSISENFPGSWILYNSNNQAIASSSLGSDFVATLPVDGDYLLVLSGSQFNSGTPVDYSFQVVTPETTTAALTIGDTVSGTIDEVGDQTEFTFAGTTGQQLYYDALGLFTNMRLNLEAPDGTQLFSFFVGADDDSGPITLMQDGTYTLIVGGDNISTGDYSFRVLDVPATAQSVTLDNPVTGTLDPSREADFYRLSGTAGERIRLDSLSISENFPGSWILYNSNNQAIVSSSLGSDFVATLPVDGDYLLVLSGSPFNSGTPVDYSFQVVTPETTTAALTIGNTVSGTIDEVGDQAEFTFAGTTGQQLFYDALGLSSNVSLSLEAPDGTRLFNFFADVDDDSGPITLTQDGAYRLIIGGDNFSTGDYSFRVLDVPATAQSVTLDNPVTGTLDPSREADLYRLTGSAGQRIVIDSLSISESFPGSWILYGSNNQAITSSSLGSDFVATLPADGDYLLVLNGSQFNSGNPIDYSFQIVSPASFSTALTFDQALSDTLGLGEIQEFTFDGTFNQRLFINDLGSSFSNGTWNLLGPNGQIITSNFLSRDFEVTLPESGIYTLSLTNNSSGPLTYNFEVITPETQTSSISLGAAAGEGTQFTYDSTFNQITSITDELGRLTLFDIDSNNGNVLSITQVISDIGGGDDLISQFTYTAEGLVDLQTDPLGRVTDFDYDAFGRVTSITFAQGTADQGIQQFEYDAAGNVSVTIDENGNRTVFDYDALNRLERLIQADPDGAGPLTSPINLFEYDDAGNLVATTDALGNITTNTYDNLDRLISSLDELDNLTQFGYDALGNLTSIIDPLGNETVNQYDARNRLIETVDPGDGVTTFGYDLDNNLTSVVDSVGNETMFIYDARNRLIEEIDPLGNSIVNEYDVVDNLLAVTDRNGRSTQFVYDDVDRLVTETWVGDTQVINYAYDKVSNLTSVSDSFSALAYTYDNRDRILSVDNAGTPNVPNVVLNYTYDAVGNILTMSDVIDGVEEGTNTYVYDALNRLTELTQLGNGVSDKRVDFGYNALNQFTSIDRYSDLGATQLVTGTSYSYDNLNRLTNLAHNNGIADIAFYNFTYDQDSRITQIVDVDGTTNYTYDDRNQLTGADHSDVNNPDETYTYDANGNRISSSLHGNGYVTGDGNRLLSDGTYNYDYDDEGNLIRQTEIASGESREFEWDYRNRLVAVIDKDDAGVETQQVEYTYDVFDRRIAKDVDNNLLDVNEGIITHFVYNRSEVVFDFVDIDGSIGGSEPVLAQRYLHGPGVDQVIAQESTTGNILWQLTDHLGTVRDLINSNGIVENHIIYDSYGNVLVESDTTFNSRYKFTGRELDVETGLYFYRSRYYNSSIGSFISEDPIGFNATDSNFYRYVFNSPVRFRDPSGNILPFLAAGVASGLFDVAFDVIDKSLSGKEIKSIDLAKTFIAGTTTSFATGGLDKIKKIGKLGKFIGETVVNTSGDIFKDGDNFDLCKSIFSQGGGKLGGELGKASFVRKIQNRRFNNLLKEVQNAQPKELSDILDVDDVFNTVLPANKLTDATIGGFFGSKIGGIAAGKTVDNF